MGSLALEAAVLQVLGMTFRAPSPVVFTATIVGLAGLLVTGCRTLEGKSPEGKSAANKEVAKTPSQDWNEAIVKAIEKMPIGGGYSVGADAKEALQSAVAWEEGKPALRPASAQPSFCSGATYLALVIALAQEQRGGRLSLTPSVWRKLVVEGQADGEGVWGRWNANGPGTARLFHELGLGRNFTDWKDAKTGDFLKIFWNDSIGAQESGHSVIYIGRGEDNGEDVVAFWSSNEPGGYGVKQVPFSKIKRAVFSRLEHPERLSSVEKLPEKDTFLASLLQKSVTPEAAGKACGLKKL